MHLTAEIRLKYICTFIDSMSDYDKYSDNQYKQIVDIKVIKTFIKLWILFKKLFQYHYLASNISYKNCLL